MSGPFDTDTKRAIRAALARDAYRRDVIRIADPDIAGFTWLVASHRGVFAVVPGKAKLAIHGWFFGIHRQHNTIWLFENCALRDRAAPLGRIVRIELSAGELRAPAVLATGLHPNCHQLAVIDGLICVADTANQAILRFTLDGAPVDIKHPFPAAPPSDTSGAYLHMNTIAKIGPKIAVMLHNGTAQPAKNSELAWLDEDWRVAERNTLDGRMCHDIVEDEHGVLWHSASMSGEIISSDGRRAKITDSLMTRGIAFAPDSLAVGITSFGPRQIRDGLRGGIVILDRDLNRRHLIELDGAPTDMISLPR